MYNRELENKFVDFTYFNNDGLTILSFITKVSLLDLKLSQKEEKTFLIYKNDEFQVVHSCLVDSEEITLTQLSNLLNEH